MISQKPSEEVILSFLNELTVDKIDEIFKTDKLEITTQEFLSKMIHFFAFYLQSFCELPPIDENVLDKFIHSAFPGFIKLILPTQDVEFYIQSLFDIGSICYFFIEKKKEISFFSILSDLIKNYKSFIPKIHTNFMKMDIFMIFYEKSSLFGYAPTNSKINEEIREEILNEKNVQFRPNREFYTINSTFVNALYLSGLFLAIRKYISDIHFFDDNNTNCFTLSSDIFTFLETCSLFMDNEYKNYFSSDLQTRLQKLDINFASSNSTYSKKFNNKASLQYCRTIRKISDLSDETSNFFNELYFNMLTNLIQSTKEEDYDSSITELLNIPQFPYFSIGFIKQLSTTFINSIIHFIKEKDIKVIELITNLLYSKEMLPGSDKLFELCSGNNFLYCSLFFYIQDLFNDTLIDELFINENKDDQSIQKVSLKTSPCELIIKLLNSGKYNKTTKLELIFRCLFNLLLSDNLFEEALIQFSEKDDFKDPIFRALSSISANYSTSDDIQFNCFFLCQILSNLNIDSNSGFPFSLISENLVYELDSVLIPQYFNTYKFLPIPDVELFWDLSIHSPLFYKLVKPKCAEIKDILFNCDDFSIGLSDCLLALFEKVNDIDVFCKSVIIAYSLSSCSSSPKSNKGDFLTELIQKLKEKFNVIKKDSKFYNDLMSFIEKLTNDKSENLTHLIQFLSEVDLTSNIEKSDDFEELFNQKDFGQFDVNKQAILILLIHRTNSAKIDDILNDSNLIENLFDSNSILAKTVIAEIISTGKISEEIIDPGFVTLAFIEQSTLGNYNICKQLINSVIISIDDDYIYYSTPDIIELIFNEKIPVQKNIFPIFPLVSNCQTYQQYETSLICLIKREPLSDQLAPFLINFILSKELPSCLRNDKIIHLVMSRISENSIGFINYVLNSSRIAFSEFQPKTNYPFLHVLTQFNDFMFDLINCKKSNELAYLIGNLKFTSFSNIQNQTFIVSKLDNLYNYIPPNLFKYFRVKFIKGNEMIEDKLISLNAENSVSDSLSKMMMKNNTILESSPILLINLDQSIYNSQFVIDETLDISNFSSNEVRFVYKLSSVVTEHNVYIYDKNHLNNQLEKEPGFICYNQNISFFIKKILEPVKYIVYKQKSFNDKLTLWKSFNLMGNQFSNSIVYDMGCTFMQVLNNPFIDWMSFKLTTPNFYDSAISLIHRLYIRSLFDTFCEDPEFSEILFKDRNDILYDESFTNTFSNEIIRAAKAFPDQGLLMCILCDDVMNVNESIFFTLLDSIDFDVDNHLFAIQRMIPFYQSKHFEDYFTKFIKSPLITKEKFHELLHSNDKIIDVIFYISDPSFVDYFDDITSIEFFRKASDSRPSFLDELISKSLDDSYLPEKIRIASSKLYDNKQYQSLVLKKINENKADDILNFEVISNLLYASNKEFRNEIIHQMEIRFPPESVKDLAIPNMIINTLDLTKDFEGLYNLVDIYHKTFRADMEITGMFIRYLFSNRPSSIVNYDKLAELTLKLPIPPIMTFISAMNGNFPLRETDQFRVMKNYTAIDIEKSYRLFFNLFGKCRFLIEFDKRHLDFDILTQTIYSSLMNKDDIVEIFNPIFFDHMKTNYLSLILIHIKRYPILLANYIDKITNYQCMKDTYCFASLCYSVSSFLLNYYQRQSFYTNHDNIDKLITKVLNTTNNFLEDVVLQPNWNPKVEHVLNYTSMIYEINITLDIMRMLKHDGKIELLRFCRNLAYSIPGFILKLMEIFSFDGRNYYNFMTEEDERIQFSELICDLFRDALGDRQIVSGPNTQAFFICGNFLNSQFMQCLNCKSLSFKTVRPFLLLLKAIIRLPCINPIKQSTLSILAKNSYIYNLFTDLSISDKILVIENNDENEITVKNDEFIELQEFVFDLIDFGKFSEDSDSNILNTNQMAIAIKKLKIEDELFNYRVILYDSIIQKLPEKMRVSIVQDIFEFVDALSAESTNENDPIQHFLIVCLENYE